MFESFGDTAATFSSDRKIYDSVLGDASFIRFSAILINLSAISPKTARNAHMVPGRLVTLFIFFSRPVAANTELIAMKHAKMTAVIDPPNEAFLFEFSLVQLFPGAATLLGI